MRKEIKKLVKKITINGCKINIDFVGGGNISVVGTDEQKVRTKPLLTGDHIMGYETYINDIAIGSNSMFIFHTNGTSVISGNTQEKEEGLSTASVGVYVNDKHIGEFDTPYHKWSDSF